MILELIIVSGVILCAVIIIFKLKSMKVNWYKFRENLSLIFSSFSFMSFMLYAVSIYSPQLFQIQTVAYTITGQPYTGLISYGNLFLIVGIILLSIGIFGRYLWKK